MSIKRGDRMFIELKRVGECDAAGKAVMSVGFTGKLIADPDRPLEMLVCPFLNEILSMARYTDGGALQADLDALVKHVNALNRRIETPKEATT